MAETRTAIANRPAWVDISCTDSARQREYYSKVFGWSVEVTADPQYGGYAMAQVDGKDVAGIGPKQSPQQPTAWAVYIGTDDADSLARAVEAAGGTVIAPPFDVGEAKSLEGNWRADLLFVLQQEVDNYDHYQKQMAGCDEKLKLHLGSLAGQENTNSEATGSPSPAKQKAKKRSKKPKGNAPAFDLGSEVQRITGVDLTLIDGVDVMTAQTVLSEVGRDMSRWKSEGHFASWLGLCPDNRITGGKVINKGTRPVVQPLASALRMAASTLIKSESYLGAQYRRLRTRLGAPKAITAMAHKLARIIYRMLKYGHGYVDRGMHFYEQQFREQQILLLQKKAAKLGFQITQLHASA